MTTKQQFMDAYCKQLRRDYSWAKDDRSLMVYMETVAATLNTKGQSWVCSGPTVTRVWKALGHKSVLSLTRLRGLDGIAKASTSMAGLA